jgi:hypothetical protein
VLTQGKIINYNNNMELQNLGPRGPRASLAGVQGNPEKAVKSVLGVKTLGNFEVAGPKEQQRMIIEVAKLRKSFAGQDPQLFYDAVCKLLGISGDGQYNDKYRGSGGPLTVSLAEFLQQAGIAGSRNESGKTETIH